VALYFLDNIFGLHLAFETAQRVLQRLAFLQSDFCQGNLLNASKNRTLYSLYDIRLVVPGNFPLFLAFLRRRKNESRLLFQAIPMVS
jgi:hypothetical protein